MNDTPDAAARDDAQEGDANEILAAVREVRERAEAVAGDVRERARRWPLGRVGLGVGIGSAAIAGAVLFATRKRDGRDHD